MNEPIRIAMAADETYAPAAGVVLRSVADCASDGRDYEVSLLTAGLADTTKAALVETVADTRIRLSFVDVCACEGYQKMRDLQVTGSHLSLAAFYRLLLPELLPTVAKVLYLDCDLLVRRDLAELFDIELGDALVAAARDFSIGQPLRSWKGYAEMLKSIGLRDAADYFNSGVLLMNLERFRAEGLAPRMLPLVPAAANYLCDQDVLNVVCSERVQWLDPRWNANVASGEGLAVLREAWIIHYAGRTKPWLALDLPEGGAWWKAADRTPFAAALRRGLRTSVRRVARAWLRFLFARIVTKLTLGRTMAFYDRMWRALRSLPSGSDIAVGSGVRSVVTCFRASFYLKSRVFVPMHAGRAVALEATACGTVDRKGLRWLKRRMPGDDRGKNISSKNRTYCEATLLYWMWKHPEAWGRLAFVGMMHYRRFLILDESFTRDLPRSDHNRAFSTILIPRVTSPRRFARLLGLTPKSILENCERHEMIFADPSDLGLAGLESVRDEYVKAIPGFHVEDLDLCVETAGRLHPPYREELEQYCRGREKVMYNLFLVRRRVFHQACRFVFDVCDAVEPRVDTTGYSLNGIRTMAYLAEFLFGFYLYHLSRLPGANYRTVPAAFLKDPQPCSCWTAVVAHLKRAIKRLCILFVPGLLHLFPERLRTSARLRLERWRATLEKEVFF